MEYNEIWNKGWNICKKYGKTSGMSKRDIYRMRSGYVRIWLNQLNYDGVLTSEEKEIYQELLKGE